MSAIVYGMPPSMNTCGPVILAMESGGGTFGFCNIMEGQHKTDPKFLAINPYSQIPMLEDGDVKIGESNAILRYLARKYKPEVYPESDPAACAMMDFALDAFSNVYKFHYKTVYITFGFASLPEGDEQGAANASYIEAIDKFLATFKGDKAFCGGDEPNLTDYKIVPFLYSAMQPANKQVIGLELPEAVCAYVNGFMAKVGAAAFMESAGGSSIKEYAATKEVSS
jgi:glutathione S-transferase